MPAPQSGCTPPSTAAACCWIGAAEIVPNRATTVCERLPGTVSGATRGRADGPLLPHNRGDLHSRARAVARMAPRRPAEAAALLRRRNLERRGWDRIGDVETDAGWTGVHASSDSGRAMTRGGISNWTLDKRNGPFDRSYSVARLIRACTPSENTWSSNQGSTGDRRSRNGS